MVQGFYYKNGKRHRNIEIRRPGIYGQGFLSKPREVRYEIIRHEVGKEGSKLVDLQMAAMYSFVSHDPKYRKQALSDLHYAESLKKRKKK